MIWFFALAFCAPLVSLLKRTTSHYDKALCPATANVLRSDSAQLPIMTKLYVICHQTFVCKRRNCDNLGVQHNKHLANQN